MVTGDNKGHVYEKTIVDILTKRNIIPDGLAGAGSGPGTDIFFVHGKKTYKLEVKNNVVGPDYGQKRLLPFKTDGGWKWKLAKDEYVTRFYTGLGVLKYLDNKNIVPNKHNKKDSQITEHDKKEDQKNFEDRTFTISSEAFSKFYFEKADYLQIGNGYGFYHLTDDVAKLGTEKFEGRFILRFRAKTHHSMPVHGYSFFAVLKCSSAKKSKYNLEDVRGQEFPPIVPN